MRIRFVVWDVSHYGGVRAIFNLAGELVNRGHDVRVVALGGDYLWSDLRVPIDFVSLGQSQSRLGRLAVGLYRGLRRIYTHALNQFDAEGIAQFFGFHADGIGALAESIPDCDACIATWYPTALAVWIAGKGKPFYLMQDYPEQMGGRLNLFMRTLQLPFCFLTNSRYTEEVVLRQQTNAKVKVVGVGVDARIFRPQGGALESNVKKIMVILRREAFKGSEVAIKVLNELSKRLSIRAILLGDVEILKAVRPRFPFAHFSRVDDKTLAGLYSSANVFLFTSYAEGFGLPPLEAMACGTPVVTTDCKGNRDYCIDRKNCLMANPGDHIALAKAAHMLLTNKALRLRLSIEGIETAKNWSWSKTADRFEEALAL